MFLWSSYQWHIKAQTLLLSVFHAQQNVFCIYDKIESIKFFISNTCNAHIGQLTKHIPLCLLFFRRGIQDVAFGFFLAQRRHQLVLDLTNASFIVAVVGMGNVQGPRERRNSFTIVGVERYYQ